jgi:carbamoyltransferase
MKRVVGIHCDNIPWTHDPNVGIVAGGELAAYEAERVTRRKYQGKELFFGDFSAPHEHFAAWLRSEGVELGDVAAVAFVMNANPYRFELPGYLEFLERILGVGRRQVHELMSEVLLGRTPLVARGLCGKPTYLVKHHTAHSAYAWYTSPFERGFVFAYDGGGFEVMTQIGHGEGARLGRFETLPDHWLGFLYTTITRNALRYLKGSEPAYGSEGKVMALAGHGTPRFLPRLEAYLRSRYTLGGYDMSQESLRIYTDLLLADPDCGSYEGEARFRFVADYAASWQSLFERAVTGTLDALHERHRFEALCIAGGCGLNGLVNEKLRERFGSVWIPPATSDSGIGLGAALFVAHACLGQPRARYGNVAYLGRSHAVDAAWLRAHDGLAVEEHDDATLYDAVARELADGRIIGWYQGRGECGPRALGNRSILCDPRAAEMKDVINLRVKHREPFRPFAPAVLGGEVARYFGREIEDPHMLTISRAGAAALAEIPAALHVDGTARVQTVREENNPRFHRLITAFHALTGVSALLNTSFNDDGQPIVDSVADAVEAFRRMDLDILVVGNCVIRKRTAS